MGGSRQGGLQTKDKVLARDPDYYAKIGSKGGKISRGGGFANGEAGRQAAIRYGAVGGAKSRRGYRITGYDAQGRPVYAKI